MPYSDEPFISRTVAPESASVYYYELEAEAPGALHLRTLQDLHQ